MKVDDLLVYFNGVFVYNMYIYIYTHIYIYSLLIFWRWVSVLGNGGPHFFQNAVRAVETLTNLVRETTVHPEFARIWRWLHSQEENWSNNCNGMKATRRYQNRPGPSSMQSHKNHHYVSVQVLIIPYQSSVLAVTGGDRQQDILYVARQYFF